jgi:hypothetical protein
MVVYLNFKNMKNLIYSTMICMLFTFVSCSKKIDVSPPALKVSLDASHLSGRVYTYKLGDTVKFTLSGYADNIALYTGDAGHNYLYRTRDTANGIPTLTFSSAEQYGAQTGTLQVLATDKLPIDDSAHVVNANWTDITSRLVLATGTTATPSGDINLKDLITGPKDSLFVAFKYTGQGGSTQRTWTITNFAVNDALADGTASAISNLSLDINAFLKFKIGSSSASWINSTTQIQVVGGSATSPANTSWVVTKPLYVNSFNRDLSVVLKSIGSAAIPSYNYKYTTAGNYTATFVIFNNTIDEQKTVIQQINIKITN